MKTQQAKEMAALFVEGYRRARVLAKLLGYSERKVKRILTSEAFITEVRARGYQDAIELVHERTGRPPERDQHNRLREAYDALVEAGTPKHKRVGILMKMEGVTVTIKTVRNWRNQWDKGINPFPRQGELQCNK